MGNIRRGELVCANGATGYVITSQAPRLPQAVIDFVKMVNALGGAEKVADALGIVANQNSGVDDEYAIMPMPRPEWAQETQLEPPIHINGGNGDYEMAMPKPKWAQPR